MNTILLSSFEINKLKIRSNFSCIYEITLNNKKYIYKEFTQLYPQDMMSNIIRLTNMNFDKHYLVPLTMVLDNRNNIIGYLMNYNEKLQSKPNEENKIILLKHMKTLIEQLHKKYKIIHCDLALNNMLFDNENKESYIIDFDTNIKIGKIIKKYNYIRIIVEDYIKKYGINYGLDIYTFNITTLMCLNCYNSSKMLLSDIRYNDLDIMNKNKDIKKLSKELLLDSIDKRYSNEYIIDYID